METGYKIGVDSYSFHLSFGKHGYHPLFHFQPKMTIKQYLDIAKKLNLQVVQFDPFHIPALSGSNFDSFAALLKQYNFEYMLGSVDSLLAEGKAAETVIKKFKLCIEACHTINAHLLRAVCGADRFRSDISMENQLDVIAKNLQEITPYALEKDVTIAFENHGDMQSEDMIALIEKVDSPNVKINLDNANPVLALEDPVEAFRRMAPYTVCLHFKDFARRQTGFGMIVEGCELGKGVVNIKEQIKFFKDVCPDARLCLELCIPRGNENVTLTNSVKYLRELLSSSD